MKKFPIIILAILFFLSGLKNLIGQQRFNLKHGCKYAAGLEENILWITAASEEAEKIKNDILGASNLPSTVNFQLRQSNVKTAVATIENGVRYILYNWDFIKDINKNAQSKWVIYSIFAHEIGHHLHLHDFTETDPKKRQEMELQADKFSGSVLMTLCAKEDEAKLALNNLTLDSNNEYYPSKSARLAYIYNGWIEQKEYWEEKGINPCVTPFELKLGENYPSKLNRARAVKGYIEDGELVITYDAEPRKGHQKCAAYIIVGNNTISPKNVIWLTDRTEYGNAKQVIWQFEKDHYTKEQIEKPELLGIGVFQPNKVPSPIPFKGFLAPSGLIIAGGLTYAKGLILKQDADRDYSIYETYREPFDPVYLERSRQSVYETANNKYNNAQIIQKAGGFVAGVGLVWLIDKFIKQKISKKGTLIIGNQSVGFTQEF